MGRLWGRANQASSKQPGRGQLDRLAERLLAMWELFLPEINAVLSEQPQAAWADIKTESRNPLNGAAEIRIDAP